MAKIIFCYWHARGLANPAKMLLEYGGVEYEHKVVTDKKGWDAERFSLGLDFPNLPYIIDGDVRLTESWAIFRYIAKKVGLYPTSDEDERQADMLQGVIQDIRSNFANSCYKPEFYDIADQLLVTQTDKIAILEKYLSSWQFLLGDKLTYLDFALYETLDHHRKFFTSIFEKFPAIGAYLKRIESIDRIDAFFKSDRFKAFPINGPQAIWGGKDYNDKK